MHRPALAGRRIIELGTMLAAPFAAHIFSQLGAEVIKVEPPSGDPTRSLVRGGPSGTFIAYSHGKKSVCIDLSKPEGHAAFCKLLKTADALVHNLSPKAARKLKLTRRDCAAANPRLIYCHIRGYGPGPLEDELASNPVAEASTGVMEANRVGGRPSRLGPSYHDQFAGAYAVIGTLASMLQLAQGDEAEAEPVEVGLYETGLHVASRDLVGVQLKTQLLGKPEREPHGEFSMPGYGAYQTSDERWIYLLMLNDTHWLKFCQALSLPNDESLATLRQRKKARETSRKPRQKRRRGAAVRGRRRAPQSSGRRLYRSIAARARARCAPGARAGQVAQRAFSRSRVRRARIPARADGRGLADATPAPSGRAHGQPCSSPPAWIEMNTRHCSVRAPPRRPHPTRFAWAAVRRQA